MNLPEMSNHKMCVKLPKLNIDKFDGTLENWQEFYSQFSDTQK